MINILGLAGSGKSTQGRLLAEYLHCPWISMGELLRSHLSGPIHLEMLEGKIIDDKQALDLLEAKLKAEGADKHECVLDGCPRTLNQAHWLAAEAKAGRLMLSSVVHLTLDKAEAKARLLERGRHDDHEAAIAERFTEYEEAILPIIDYLKQQNIPVFEVDAAGPIAEVAARIHQALGV